MSTATSPAEYVVCARSPGRATFITSIAFGLEDRELDCLYGYAVEEGLLGADGLVELGGSFARFCG